MPLPPANPRPPELLAPAGNRECIEAAIENGADAVYFGLQVGFNARGRATNLTLEELPEVMDHLHLRGLRGYVTVNTLAFTDELPRLESHLRAIAEAGVDAALVQDLGVARLARVVCPTLALHASTQMTMTCAEMIAVAAQLGIERVVLARELSLKEIRKIAAETTVELETFVHGALCVAYSGQCLTSESLGGRSANRGECAQACRLAYELECDGQPVELGDVKYLLSPQDLAAYELLPDLIDAGVASLKIEGRLKTPEYVANVCRHYRAAIDSAVAGRPLKFNPASRRELELSFSRGFSPGWTAGNDHKRLVPGLSSSKRGVLIGRVVKLRDEKLEVELTQPLRRGDGIVLEGDREAGEEVGGSVYEVLRRGRPVDDAASGRLTLLMEHGLLADADVWPDQLIWQTSDPQLTKRLRGSFGGSKPSRTVDLAVHARVVVGRPIEVEATCSDGVRVSVTHDYLPETARKHPASEATLREQFDRLGGSGFRLASFTAKIGGQPMTPLSVLGAIRKQMLAQLAEARQHKPAATLGAADAAQQMIQSAGEDASGGGDAPAEPQLSVLCRSLAQLRAALDAGARHVYADLHDLREYRPAVAAAHAAGAQIHLATLRIHKPGENGLFLNLQKHGGDGWLVRNLAALDFARRHEIPAVADFSLNVTNPITAAWLIEQGAAWLTASYDLNRDQVLELAAATPPRWLEVVVHQHMPMFHMEHCVFCAVLSPGKNKTDCGRPCDRHQVELTDRVGVKHVLHADIGCRNTLYNGAPQSGAEAVAPLIGLGVRRFRIELLRDAPPDETKRLVGLYQDLLAGRATGAEVWRSLRAANRLGVTRGPLEAARNPLAVL
ncbi:putative protease YhbU precursor [Pirellulimonas nuda]|uniref:Putative protease YhbU n=1 Tax=Pirellulimonas nuda TaxID=2528009 RepID=A0A518DJR9_9BACT|nr:U32 family peptidase [Pirellulimonas nuda]QDU91696.1 putative protease YhbU precursor [Pirellulimonas nuda]